MKKIKLLTPMLSVAALSAFVAPIATSCSQAVEDKNIPTDLLNIVGYTLKGFKDGVDITKYDTLVIPEGVKYIDNNAFKDVFKTGTTNGCIRTVVFPTTLREIRTSAFNGCDSLRVLDFSGWTHDEIHYLNVADATVFNYTSKLGRVIYDQNITDESKEKLEKLLCDDGALDKAWFAPVSEDKMTADEAWKVQKKENGKKAVYLFTCNVDLKGASLYAQVTRTGGTKNVDVTCTSTALSAKEGKVYELQVSLMNHENTDDYADFDVTFTAIQDASGATYTPVWQQTLTGFKLINIKAESSEIDLLDYEWTPSYDKYDSTAVHTVDQAKEKFFDKLNNYKDLLIDEWHYNLMSGFKTWYDDIVELKETLEEAGIAADFIYRGNEGGDPTATLKVENFTFDSQNKTISCNIALDFDYVIGLSYTYPGAGETKTLMSYVFKDEIKISNIPFMLTYDFDGSWGNELYNQTILGIYVPKDKTEFLPTFGDGTISFRINGFRSEISPEDPEEERTEWNNFEASGSKDGWNYVGKGTETIDENFEDARDVTNSMLHTNANGSYYLSKINAATTFIIPNETTVQFSKANPQSATISVTKPSTTAAELETAFADLILIGWLDIAPVVKTSSGTYSLTLTPNESFGEEVAIQTSTTWALIYQEDDYEIGYKSYSLSEITIKVVE